MRGVLPDAVVKGIEEQLSGACTTEIAAFDEFTALLADTALHAQYEHILFDTAPAVADAAQQLHKAVDALEGSRNPWADQFLSQERLHRLDGLLQVVTDGLQSDADATAPDPAANRTATALVILPELVDQAREAAASHRRPLAVPLLIRRDIEALKLQAAQRDIATQQAELRLSRELLDALYQQAHQLWLAERELQQDGTGPGAPPDLRKLRRRRSRYLRKRVENEDADIMGLGAWEGRTPPFLAVRMPTWGETSVGTLGTNIVDDSGMPHGRLPDTDQSSRESPSAKACSASPLTRCTVHSSMPAAPRLR